MTRLLFSERFANDLSRVTSDKVERRILSALDAIESAGDVGSRSVPRSIRLEFGSGVRKLATNPFDLVYTYDQENDIAYIEALIYQCCAW